ncbi:MAG: putative ArgK protein with ATPase and kinase domain [Bacteroidota bacterium]|nr:putative ArgK protein with ATPase and kinase domain [Bacteroidota bacterium]
MSKAFNINEYVDGILSSSITYVSKAITLVESTKHEHQENAQEIINAVIKHSGNSFRLGITGVPGVGKSTFIESFGLEVIKRGHKLAVLAVDPSSQLSKGSILGDKTRMEQLSIHADGMVITKADGTNIDKAKLARAEYARALHLFPPTESNWIPEVLTCSSTENKGIAEVYDMIDKYKRHTTLNHFFETKRANQTKQWLHQTINDELIERFYANPQIKEEIFKIEQQLQENLINPHRAVQDLFKKI